MTETVKIADAQEFDAFVASCPKGHMMQASAWGKVKNNWDWTGVISRDESGNIKGVCAVLSRKMPMMPWKMMYAPRGPVCDLSDSGTVTELLEAVKEYGLKNKAYAVTIDTDALITDTAYIDLLKSLGYKFKDNSVDFNTIQSRYIFRMDLRGKTEDEAMMMIHSKARNCVRKAIKEGVEIVEKGPEAVEEFHRIMQITGERDNFSTRGPEYFRRVMDAYGENARMCFAYYDGKAIGCTLHVLYGDKVWWLYGASSNEHRDLQPNYLLQWEAIKWTLSKGAGWYDLRGGYPDENNPLHGIFKFKKKFCKEYMEFMGEADLIISKTGFAAVTAAQKFLKKTKKIRAKISNR
ncbi:MAG: peptidoglycan bridge formation glycyltransferase FemA/FemB family protein [Clostridia bacterium]|nr:peptidoglycan bridge formation glycyltransferase FemA/FemB family protein [Clostridia bacterium]